MKSVSLTGLMFVFLNLMVCDGKADTTLQINNLNVKIKDTGMGSFALPSPLRLSFKNIGPLAADCATFIKRMNGSDLLLSSCANDPNATADSYTCRRALQRINRARFDAPDNAMTAADARQIWSSSDNVTRELSGASARSEIGKALNIPGELVHNQAQFALDASAVQSIEFASSESSWTKKFSKIKGYKAESIQVGMLADGNATIATYGRDIACDLLQGNAVFKTVSNVKLKPIQFSDYFVRVSSRLTAFRLKARDLQEQFQTRMNLGLVKIGSELAKVLEVYAIPSNENYKGNLLTLIFEGLFDQETSKLKYFETERDMEKALSEVQFEAHPIEIKGEL